MATNEELAELLFPDVTETIEDLEKKYPPRELPEGAQVTRFANDGENGVVWMGDEYGLSRQR